MKTTDLISPAVTKSLSVGLLAILASFAVGCRQPTAADRDNRRVVECLLTAITLHNPQLLEDNAKWAAERHDAGQLANADYREIEAIVEEARRGNWLAAEEAGYQFRERRPFVKSGR
jgi:hypothetical protein